MTKNCKVSNFGAIFFAVAQCSVGSFGGVLMGTTVGTNDQLRIAPSTLVNPDRPNDAIRSGGVKKLKNPGIGL